MFQEGLESHEALGSQGRSGHRAESARGYDGVAQQRIGLRLEARPAGPAFGGHGCRKPAFFAEEDDVIENIDNDMLALNSDFVMEVLKHI